MTRPRFAFGPFLLDASSGTLLEHGLPVDLGAKGLALLRALVEAQGQVVTKTARMGAAWPDVSVGKSNLTVQIAALRKRLRVSPDDEDWIVTFPRVGYRFAGSIRVEGQDASIIHPRPANESKPSKLAAILAADVVAYSK